MGGKRMWFIKLTLLIHLNFITGYYVLLFLCIFKALSTLSHSSTNHTSIKSLTFSSVTSALTSRNHQYHTIGSIFSVLHTILLSISESRAEVRLLVSDMVPHANGLPWHRCRSLVFDLLHVRTTTWQGLALVAPGGKIKFQGIHDVKKCWPPIFYFFACLSYLNVSDQTNLNICQK